MLVLELHSTVDEDELRRSGLLLLDGSDRHAVVAFADDPDMTIFLDRLSLYRGPIPDDQKSAPHQSFFDAIVTVRPYGPEDRISPQCEEVAARASADSTMRLDVRCWYPPSGIPVADWLEELRTGVASAGGLVVDVYQNDGAEMLLARISIPAQNLHPLSTLDVIASIDVLPNPQLTRAEFFGMSADDLPALVPPPRDAPLLGLIDSGVASAHPLLAGTVYAAETLSPEIADGEDRHGHGTMIASLALYGPLAPALRGPQLLPLGRILSVAVLDGDLQFPSGVLWEHHLSEAIEYCAAQGARVINISIGDPTRPFRPPRQSAVASLLDHLARIHDLVLVTCTGNGEPASYTSSADPTTTYLADLISDPSSGILPPGTAALALTVGGIVHTHGTGAYGSREIANRRAYGLPGWPSSVTRRGPGVERAIKPEFVAASGTHAFESPRRAVVDPELNVVGASLGGAGRLLASDLGTSYAAPLVSRVALGVVSRFPEFSANLVRALLLMGAEAPRWTGENLEFPGAKNAAAEVRRAVRHLVGYGETSLDGALTVSDHRAILVAEGSLEMDTVHIYELPIPQAFFDSGGQRTIDIALAFDPPTRAQRLDYLGNKVEFYLVRDIELSEVSDIFTKATPGVGESDEGADGEDGPPAGIGKALGKRNVVLDVAVQDRARSANQRASKKFRQRLRALPEGGGWFVVVRSVNRWCDETLLQPYALAISLRRDDEHGEIFAELANVLEAVAEVRVEVGLESELG